MVSVWIEHTDKKTLKVNLRILQQLVDRIIVFDFMVYLAIVSLCQHLVERNNIIPVYCMYSLHRDKMKGASHLPDPDNSVGDEDKKNDNGLNKGGGCLLSLLKQSQHLDEHTYT